MLEKLNHFIRGNKLFNKKRRILVAVSGGMDSVVLCRLLHEAGYKTGIAHCNFNLRGKESDGDEKFVIKLAGSLNIPLYLARFSTLKYAEEKGVSVQMAARELRYFWFEKIRIENRFDYIATAHHQDDETETFFINLIRGTGIAGLHGIKAKAGKIVRPLLFAGKKDIEEYVEKNKIKFREDSSNLSEKYLRNRIRLKLIPLLKEMNPDIEKTLKRDIGRLRQTEDILKNIIEEKKQEIIKQDAGIIKLDIAKLQALNHTGLFLFEFLKQYNFTGDIIDMIAAGLNATTGKLFYSSTHRLVKDREYLLLSPVAADKTEQTYYIGEGDKELKTPVHLKFRTVSISENIEISKEKNTGMFDYSKLHFPLTVRKWKKGDYFYPFGMKGKKKLSDFFTDLKLSLNDKENTWLLCSGNDIIWVIGYRTDNRYRVKEMDKTFIARLV